MNRSRYLNSPRPGVRKARRFYQTRGDKLIALGKLVVVVLLSPIWVPVALVALPFVLWRKFCERKKAREAPPQPIPPQRPVDPELERRRAVGMRDSRGFHLIDPISKDPALAWVFNEVSTRARDEIGHEYRMGDCHRVWRRMKQILKEDYDIIWYSPREMNPGVKYD
jgi:hypothetical protein